MFSIEPVDNLPDYSESVNLINKKYSPRSSFNIEIFSYQKRGFKRGEHIIPVFKTKEAYCQDHYFEVGFIYKNKLISIESEYITEKHNLIRLIRAHVNGYKPILTINKVTNGLVLTLTVTFKKGNLLIDKRITRGKSTKTRGKFVVSGYHHLTEEVKRLVWKELKVGDELQLVSDPKNKYDNYAVKVLYRNIQIGWIPAKYNRKKLVFETLEKCKIVNATCTKNKRDQDYVGGDWRNKYLGMAQFVEVTFEFKKDS